MKKVLVTGAAGFIGSHTSRRLLKDGVQVVGIDNFNDYYSVSLKEARAAELERIPGFQMVHGDLADRESVRGLFVEGGFDGVVHLAAQAGVRYSIDNPAAYIDSNLVGFGNIVEGCRQTGVRHLVYASSSSVYGANVKTPFSEADPVNHPVSLYAATKKANELIAHTYSHLFNLPTTGLRFFTVYGPWGRPDMAYFKFTQAILAGKPIDVYNFGDLKRDFTYIDDIVEGVVRALGRIPQPNPDWDRANPDPATSYAPYRVYNIGNNSPVPLMEFIGVLEAKLGVKAQLNMLPMQPGDVYETYADVSSLAKDVGFSPSTPIDVGLERFVDWYRSYYGG